MKSNRQSSGQQELFESTESSESTEPNGQVSREYYKSFYDEWAKLNAPDYHPTSIDKAYLLAKYFPKFGDGGTHQLFSYKSDGKIDRLKIPGTRVNRTFSGVLRSATKKLSSK
tara:strand:- start:4780 stop:5118 length:339 start_codon:yes stop_codon:yes gene_type:complete